MYHRQSMAGASHGLKDFGHGLLDFCSRATVLILLFTFWAGKKMFEKIHITAVLKEITLYILGTGKNEFWASKI